MTASLALLAAATPSFFAEVATLLVAGAVIAYLGNRLGFVPIVGFLLAGVVIGPNALGLVRDPVLVDAAAEVGVVLLLFTIGIEFSLEKLSRIRRLILVGGGLQVALASCLTLLALLAFGVDWRAGLFTGFLVALSSTAIVLKLLADRGETQSERGQIALALLIFQDLAIIAMVLLVPMLAGAGGTAGGAAWALLRAVALIAGVLVLARRLMPAVLETVARTCSPELFLLTIIAICFGTAYLTSMAGVSLSLGAFLAGLLVSESSFSEHALGEILPLQILFSATFFVSVGMLLDPAFLLANLPVVLIVIAAVLVLKTITTGAAVLALGYRLPVAVGGGLLLAQVGEFSFVLERAGRELGLTPAGLGESGSQAFIAATVVLMVLTPGLARAADRLAASMERRRDATGLPPDDESRDEEIAERFEHLDGHTIVAGYGAAARRLTTVLRQARLPYVVTTLSPGGAQEAEQEGHPVLRGDSSRARTLELVGIQRARMLVIADDEPIMARRIAAVGRTSNPSIRILERTRYLTEIEPLLAAGADVVITEELESVVQVFAEVLRTYHVDPDEIERYEQEIRGRGYRALDASPDHAGIEPCRSGDACDPAAAPLAGAAAAVAADDAKDGKVRRAAPNEAPASAGASAAGELHDTRAGRTTIDTERRYRLDAPPDPRRCSHARNVTAVNPSATGCEDCLAIGDTWVHLRLCMTCGHVGCCDSSRNRHATRHYHATGHPIVRSLEPGEDWAWCYEDRVTL